MFLGRPPPTIGEELWLGRTISNHAGRRRLNQARLSADLYKRLLLDTMLCDSRTQNEAQVLSPLPTQLFYTAGEINTDIAAQDIRVTAAAGNTPAAWVAVAMALLALRYVHLDWSILFVLLLKIFGPDGAISSVFVLGELNLTCHYATCIYYFIQTDDYYLLRSMEPALCIAGHFVYILLHSALPLCLPGCLAGFGFIRHDT